MTSFDDRPTRPGMVISLGLGLTAAFFAGSGTGLGVGMALVGGALLLGGLGLAVRPLLTAGGVVLFTAHLLRIGMGGSLELSLVGATFAVAAWDVGEHAIDLGEYVGRSARSRHAVLAHAAASLAVGLVPVGIGYGVYLLAPGGRPLSALVLLLLAVVLVTLGLRR
ncbi:MAG: hypothetical protein ABEJ27_02790 [Halodesulfurarchaeum sp.]